MSRFEDLILHPDNVSLGNIRDNNNTNYRKLRSWLSSLEEVEQIVEQAKAHADDAEGNASDAISKANSAVDTANSAENTANQAVQDVEQNIQDSEQRYQELQQESEQRYENMASDLSETEGKVATEVIKARGDYNEIDDRLNAQDSEISNAETVSGAQDKADAAENAAESYADSVAAEAESSAKSYTDNQTANMETTSGAQSKADAAENAANSYTDDQTADMETNAGAQSRVDELDNQIQNDLSGKFDKNGGTIDGHTTAETGEASPLTVRRTGDDNNIAVEFAHDGASRHFGLTQSGEFAVADDANVSDGERLAYQSDVNSVDNEIVNHVDSGYAHDSSSIVVDHSDLSASDVEGALVDLQSNINSDGSGGSSAEMLKYKNESPNGPFHGVWQPMKTMQGAGWDQNDVPNSNNPDEVLDALLGYMLDDPYVSRTSIGTSEDGGYDMWQYDFKPPHYEKTIILYGGLHGNEYTAPFALMRFLQELYDHWEDQPALHYLRKSVRVVAVPICNPYGFDESTRENVNNIDLNRNFDYNFRTTDSTYDPGNQAFGQQEAINLRDFMEKVYNEEDGNVIGALDFHTTTSDGSTEHLIYYPRFLTSNFQPYLQMEQHIRQTGENTAFATTTLATMTNYGVHRFGWNGANPEFVNVLDSSRSYRDSYEMTRAVSWFGNLILRLAKMEYKAKSETLMHPQLHVMKYDERNDSDAMTFSYASSTPMTNTTIEFAIKTDSIIKADGYMVIDLDEQQEISIIPQLYQRGSPDFSFGDTGENDPFNEMVMTLSAGTHVIPINADMQASITNEVASDSDNTSARTRNLVFQFRIAAQGAGGVVRQIRSRINVLPSADGWRYVRYNYANRDESTYTITLNYPSDDDAISYDHN